jgi:hypothetical protein
MSEANSAQAIVEFSRWFMAATLGVNGALLLLGPRQFAAVCPHVSTRGLPAVDAQRICAARGARQRREDVPAWYGVVAGLGSLGFAAACAAGVATPALWYAAAFLTFALVMGAAYTRVRAAAGKRVAVLNARDPGSVVPPVWFAAAAGVAIAALVSSELRAPNWAAALIGASALASTWIAFRVSAMPALLAGDDVAAERYVDERLRFGRTTAVLLLAFVQVFVFVMYDVGWPRNIPLALSVTLAWVGFSVWTIARKAGSRQVALT